MSGQPFSFEDSFLPVVMREWVWQRSGKDCWMSHQDASEARVDASMDTQPEKTVLLLLVSWQIVHCVLSHCIGFWLKKLIRFRRVGGNCVDMCYVVIILTDRIARRSCMWQFIENLPESRRCFAWVTVFESVRQMPGFPETWMKYLAFWIPLFWMYDSNSHGVNFFF